MNEIDIFELFGGVPREYEIKRERRVFGNGTPLVSAELAIPMLEGENAETVNSFYCDMAAKFIVWLSGDGLAAANAVFESDPDPHRRFRFRRFCFSLAATPGFVSGEFVSVGVTCTATRGGSCLGAWVGAQQWRMKDGKMLLLRHKNVDKNGREAVFFTRDGQLAVLEATSAGVSERRSKIDNSLTEFKMISKLFATIR